MNLLEIAEIAARLDDRGRLLTSGPRTADPRQRTLRAAVDWSHQLLTDAERVLFRRLVVFHGGWILDAAEQVCGLPESDDADGDDLDVLDLHARLLTGGWWCRGPGPASACRRRRASTPPNASTRPASGSGSRSRTPHT